jgi:hypothetical protein
MSKVDELIKELKIPHFYRDLMFILGGLGFILVLHYSNYQNIFEAFWIEQLGQAGNLFLLMTTLYIFGRLLNEMAGIILSIYYFLTKTKLDGKRLKQGLSWLFLGHYLEANFSAREVEKEITNVDMTLLLQQNPLVASTYERSVFGGIFQRIFFSTTLIFTFLISWYFFIFAFIFFLLSLHTDLGLAELQIEISKKIHYERIDELIKKAQSGL